MVDQFAVDMQKKIVEMEGWMKSNGSYPPAMVDKVKEYKNLLKVYNQTKSESLEAPVTETSAIEDPEPVEVFKAAEESIQADEEVLFSVEEIEALLDQSNTEVLEWMKINGEWGEPYQELFIKFLRSDKARFMIKRMRQTGFQNP